MNKIQRTGKALFGAVLLCLSLLAYSMPSAAMQGNHTMQQSHVMVPSAGDMNSEHCVEELEQTSDDCCDAGECSGMCLNATSVYTLPIVQADSAGSEVRVFTSLIATLNNQVFSIPSPPPIISL